MFNLSTKTSLRLASTLRPSAAMTRGLCRARVNNNLDPSAFFGATTFSQGNESTGGDEMKILNLDFGKNSTWI
jgi:hypothetical protein